MAQPGALYDERYGRNDLMNDPVSHPSTMDLDDEVGDVETCRICRTEAGEAESLFHPCKCSGSIKYVHQECLMEWLSHSQKKHCELCKTPFRFTKLYSPNMPQAVPFHLLVRHVFLHMLKNLGTWLRFVLVVFVWLGCLPYVIRQVWGLLFWFSDGGWPVETTKPVNQTLESSYWELLKVTRKMISHGQSVANGTSPVTPLLAAQTTSVQAVSGVMGLVNMVASLVGNGSDSDARNKGFLKAFTSVAASDDFLSMPDPNTLNATANLLGPLGTLSPATLLSEVHFLKNFTRFASVNRVVVSIVEGYVITFLVVICFILIFLIREWVVQQQPGINVGAGFNADFAPVERARDRQALRDENHRELLNLALPLENQLPQGEDVQNDDEMPQTNHTTTNGESHGGYVHNRPFPVRDALSPAAEIQRALTEEPRFTEDFLAIWRRAEGDPLEVLRIIDAEDRGEQMRYWVNSMRSLPHTFRGDTGQSSNFSSHQERSVNGGDVSRDELTPTVSYDELEDHHKSTYNGSPILDDWYDFQEPLQEHDHTQGYPYEAQSHADEDKGKATAEEYHNPSLPTIFSSSSGTRPRAISDGPHPSHIRSPLGSGTWTFNNLPDTAGKTELQHPQDRETPAEGDDMLNIPLLISRVSESSHSSSIQLQSRGTQDQRLHRVGEPSGSESNDVRPNAGQDSATSWFAINSSLMNVDVQDALRDWDDRIANVPDVDHGSEHHGMERTEVIDDELANDPFDNDAPLLDASPTTFATPIERRGIIGSISDFCWGGIDGEQTQDQGGDAEHIVLDVAAEAPFVPVQHANFNHDDDDHAENDQARFANADRAEIAVVPGLDFNDADAMDDAEDFDGILDLIGMRGPMFGLVQNAIFSAFLLSLTVAFGVWIPYNFGRVTLLLLANPETAFKLPLKFIFGCAAFIQDLAMSLLGLMGYLLMRLFSPPLLILRMLPTSFTGTASSGAATVRSAALSISSASFQRISNTTLDALLHIGDSDIFTFSAASHESLIVLRSLASKLFNGVGTIVAYIISSNEILVAANSFQALGNISRHIIRSLSTLPTVLAKPETWVISLEIPKRGVPLDLALSVWSGTDRFWAVITGYTAVCVLGALYVKKGTPFSSGQAGREWEATIIDLLNQAGGVFKVILIISIEMLVFPLYCGLLLDVALLPIFDNATVMSRILFTYKSPFTSIFVHWFVGTCYMFHFALFVSMCRKIMRKGVLYFIRDPDDPTFHPVRDVLERNVATQLRKILFSALVYGALVIICLGGVVWGLEYTFRGVLPIHWSSNEPVLEFPIDLLFYNFLMPLAVRFFKPSDALHTMYTWWFRRCARMLRLTWFMFDERQKDEEGYQLHRTWRTIFDFGSQPTETVKVGEADTTAAVDNSESVVPIQRNGRYVRAPASDQVRIPKGHQIFLEVDENNQRLDGKPDEVEGMHGSGNTLYKHLYVPPWFRVRIFTFILSIWGFAAFTGVSVTIIPLVLGRLVFAKVIPQHVRKNDVYAFSIGVYILGSVLYAAVNLKRFYKYLKNAVANLVATPNTILRKVVSVTSLAARIAWTYTAFLVILPTLFAAVVEFYFIVPLHSYFALEERHIVHFVQSWTLGLLYVKLTTRFILWHENSRQALSLQAITRNGYLNPDARLATRCFIVPVGFVLSVALLLPMYIAKLSIATFLKDKPEAHVLAHRYAYPLTLCGIVVLFALYSLWGMLKQWQMLIKDEVYLIGERLHNFGERKSTQVGVAQPLNMRRMET